MLVAQIHVAGGFSSLPLIDPELLDFVFPTVFQPDEIVSCLPARLDQLIDLGVQRSTVAVLGRLKDRQEHRVTTLIARFDPEMNSSSWLKYAKMPAAASKRQIISIVG